MSTLPVSPVPARRRDQRAFTLIEVLAAVAIIATVMVPVTAWALLAMKQQTALQDRNTTSTASGLLRTYLTGDVASASSLAAPGTGCPVPPPPPPPPATPPRLVMTLGSDAGTTVYLIRPMVGLDGLPVPGKSSLWRVECDDPAADVQIVEDVGTALESVSATCEPGASCRVVTLVATRVEDPSHLIKLTVERRPTS